MLKHKTSENGRMLITYNLPSASLEELSGTAGIKHLYSGHAAAKRIFDGKKDPRPEKFLSRRNAAYKTDGIRTPRAAEFIWWPRSNRGNEEPRVFYKTFVTPTQRSIRCFRKNGTGIAMFGSSIPDIESVMQNR